MSTGLELDHHRYCLVYMFILIVSKFLFFNLFRNVVVVFAIILCDSIIRIIKKKTEIFGQSNLNFESLNIFETFLKGLTKTFKILEMAIISYKLNSIE